MGTRPGRRAAGLRRWEEADRLVCLECRLSVHRVIARRSQASTRTTSSCSTGAMGAPTHMRARARTHTHTRARAAFAHHTCAGWRKMSQSFRSRSVLTVAKGAQAIASFRCPACLPSSPPACLLSIPHCPYMWPCPWCFCVTHLRLGWAVAGQAEGGHGRGGGVGAGGRQAGAAATV